MPSPKTPPVTKSSRGSALSRIAATPSVSARRAQTRPGNPCSADGNQCTDDVCGSNETCTHPPSGVGDTCDDGQFCTAVDTCNGQGSCLGAGDPCAGGEECLDTCNESEDSCLDPVGTMCSADTNQCTNDVCDGAGACIHPPLDSGDPCDDGLFCTATDLCDGTGVCQGAGDPVCRRRGVCDVL